MYDSELRRLSRHRDGCNISTVTSRRELAFITPIAPSSAGNGLAMRAFLFLSAARRDFAVRVLIVPVAGQAGRASGAAGEPAAVLELPGGSLPDDPPAQGPPHGPRWRERMAQARPLPYRAEIAPATLAADAVRALAVPPGTPVHVTRSYLAPLGVAIAERLGSRWASLDLDDDDEQVVRALGDDGDADAYCRLVGVFGPLFQAVSLAAPHEAAAVSRRHGLAASVIPNAVSLPDPGTPGERVGWPARDRPDGIRVLFVGNLTYPPNADAAVRLVHEVLPRLREMAGRPVAVTLAGEPDDTVRSLAAEPGVQVTGFVPDLAPCYRDADVVVAPLAAGGGTRIKLLEAFGYGLPVVTSTVGAAGLDVADGVHVLMADSPGDAARAVAALATDRGLRERLVTQARRLVSSSYSHDAVIPRIREFFAAAEPGAGSSGVVSAGSAAAAPARSLAVRGSFRGASGHDHHTREFVRQLTCAGVRIQLTDMPHWHPVKLPPDARDPWFERLVSPVPAASVLQFCMPHQVVAGEGRLTVNYTMFEASKVPADWVARGRDHDLVVVPTRSSLEAWLASGYPRDKVRTCPLGVDVDRFGPSTERLSLPAPGGRPVRDYEVRVLNVSDSMPRKNLAGLVRTWITATSAGDDAILIVKVGPATREATSALFRRLAIMEQALGKRRDQAAPILFVNRLLADAEMPRLYAAATHYWSMSHGEGWDQPMTEAAATGLRLIAPAHTAYLDYLDSDVAQLIPVRAVPADARPDPWTAELFEGAHWWTPDEDAAGQALRNAIDGRDQPAASIRDRLASAFSWPQAGARLIEILTELHDEHGRRF
jgi:glycosyltransferase involved in cell wall biosynthesis